MAVERPVLLRFMTLYCALFSAFGCASPFLPAFLAGRGLGPEELGLVLGGATASATGMRAGCRAYSGSSAGLSSRTCRLRHFGRKRRARVPRSPRVLDGDGHHLVQAAALAPLVPLADALSLAHARPRQSRAGFEYGWVRGVGSAAFVAGTLLAGHAAEWYGLSSIMWLSATALLAIPFAATFVPAISRKYRGCARPHGATRIVPG